MSSVRTSLVRTEFEILAALALPIIATNLGTMMLGVIDVWMVARYSSEALAASAIANTWINGTMLFGMGLVMGIDPIVTQAHGAGDRQRTGLALQRGVVVALLASLPIAALWAVSETFLTSTGQSAELSHAAHRYTLVQIPSLPFYLVFVALRQHLQGRGIVKPALWIILGTNVLNAIFNALLIFGRLGFPELGLEGAGIATALSRSCMLLGLFTIARRQRLHSGAWTPWSWRALAPRGLIEVFGYGVPTGIQMALEVWAFAAAALMAGRLGTLPIAAHAIVITMASVSFMMPMGVSFAAVTHVGNLVGQRAFARAQRAAWIAFAMGAGVMTLAGIAFLVFRHELPALFTGDADVLALCATILPIGAAFQIFDGVQVVGAGILRGMGRTQPAAWFNLLAYWVLSLPIGWWLAFRGGLGLRGLWWGLALGLAIVAVLLLFWIRGRGPASLAHATGAGDGKDSRHGDFTC